MADDWRFQHLPVMQDEVVALVAPVPTGFVLDATVGGGGHAAAILESCPELQLIGLDQDPLAIDAATERLARFGDRVRLIRTRFDRLGEALASLEVDRLSAFVFDLGVSSPQFDRAERGFSFRQAGPLDMRMDPDASVTAADIVNTADHRRLVSILRDNADERYAGRIAAAIVANRPFLTTTDLAAVVVEAIPAPARRTGGHPATRTFQALRIEVNRELSILRPALEQAIDLLVEGGRGLVLTYHSGEDRIAKDVFRGRSTVELPVGLPVPTPVPDFTVLRPQARRPSPNEVEQNPRAASARLRAIERSAMAA